MRHCYSEGIWEFELELRRFALVELARPRWHRLEEQLRETFVVSVAGGRIAVWQNPFRVLRQQSIVHLALKLRVSRNFSGEHWRMGRAHLPPHVLPSRDRIEDAIPPRLEVKRRHIEEEHWIVPAPARLQKLPPIRALVRGPWAAIGFVHDFESVELARENEQAKEAKHDSQDWAYQGKQGGEIPLTFHICI